MDGIAGAFGILGFIVAVCLLPIVLFFENKAKKTMVRSQYIFFSLGTVIVFGFLLVSYMKIMLSGSSAGSSGDTFFYGMVLILAIARYFQLMITVRRLRDIQWGGVVSIAIAIPGFGPLFWLLFALWPGKKPTDSERILSSTPS